MSINDWSIRKKVFFASTGDLVVEKNGHSGAGDEKNAYQIDIYHKKSSILDPYQNQGFAYHSQ